MSSRVFIIFILLLLVPFTLLGIPFDYPGDKTVAASIPYEDGYLFTGYVNSPDGENDVFLLKTSKSLKLLWHTIFEYEGDEKADTVVVDKKGRIWVSGVHSPTNSKIFVPMLHLINKDGTLEKRIIEYGEHNTKMAESYQSNGYRYVFFGENDTLVCLTYFGRLAVYDMSGRKLWDTVNIMPKIKGGTLTPDGNILLYGYSENGIRCQVITKKGDILRDFTTGGQLDVSFSVFTAFYDKGELVLIYQDNDTKNIYIRRMDGLTFSFKSETGLEASGSVSRIVRASGEGVYVVGQKDGDSYCGLFDISGTPVWEYSLGGDFEDYGVLLWEHGEDIALAGITESAGMGRKDLFYALFSRQGELKEHTIDESEKRDIQLAGFFPVTGAVMKQPLAASGYDKNSVLLLGIDKEKQFPLLKRIDLQGNVLWETLLTREVISAGGKSKIRVFENGSIDVILAGKKGYYHQNNSVVRLDGDGEIKKHIQLTQPLESPEIAYYKEGGFMVSGHESLFYYDNRGSLAWQRKNIQIMTRNNSSNELLKGLSLRLPGGDYIFAGTKSFFITDEYGGVKRTQPALIRNNLFTYNDMALLKDSSVIIAGSLYKSHSQSVLALQKVDSQGNVIWHKRYEATNSAAYEILPLSDGTFILYADKLNLKNFGGRIVNAVHFSADGMFLKTYTVGTGESLVQCCETMENTILFTTSGGNWQNPVIAVTEAAYREDDTGILDPPVPNVLYVDNPPVILTPDLPAVFTADTAGDTTLPPEIMFHPESTSEVVYFQWHPGGRYVALSTKTGEIVIWDVLLKQPVRVLDLGFEYGIRTFWNKAGDQLIVNYRHRRDGTVLLYDFQSDSVLWRLNYEDATQGSFFDEDQKILLFLQYDGYVILDAANGGILFSNEEDRFLQPNFIHSVEAPNILYFSSSGNDLVRMVYQEEGVVFEKIPLGLPFKDVTALAVFPETGRFLMAGYNDDYQRTQYWGIYDKDINLLEGPFILKSKSIYTITISPDESTAFMTRLGYDASNFWLDLETFEQVEMSERHNDSTRRINSHGSLIFVDKESSFDDRFGIYNPATEVEKIFTPAISYPSITTVRLSDDAEDLYIRTEGGCVDSYIRWSLSSGMISYIEQEEFNAPENTIFLRGTDSIVLEKRGGMILSLSEGGIEFLNAPGGEPVFSFRIVENNDCMRSAPPDYNLLKGPNYVIYDTEGYFAGTEKAFKAVMFKQGDRMFTFHSLPEYRLTAAELVGKYIK